MSWHELLTAERIAFDIEIEDAQTLSCVAFSAVPSRSYVFPVHDVSDANWLRIRKILGSPVPKVAQSGQFDLYFLRTRCEIEVTNYQDDTIIAWHACYPELAGAAQDKKRAKHTRKSLAFLASLYTTDEWWKDYDFESVEEEYRLCGRDACITLEIMEELDLLIDRLGVRSIYEHQLKLIEPCITMQARGIQHE